MKSKLLLFCAVLMTFKSMAITHMITVADFSFSPAAVSVTLGDTVMWMWSSGTHTTTSSSIPTGAATWDHSITSSSTSFIYVPTVTGTYGYVCTIHASMGMAGAFNVTLPTNVATPAPVPSSVYPNPAGDHIGIGLKNMGAASVSVYDLTGKRLVTRSYAPATAIDLSTAELPDGTYIVRVEQDAGVYNQRIVINH